MRFRKIGRVLILLVLLAPSVEARAEGVSRILISRTSGTPSEKISILFIGNSYIYVNDLPSMLISVASGDKGGSAQFEVQSVTQGGARLKDLWDAGDARKVLHSRHWDYVVLQEQSLWAMSPAWVQGTEAAVADWSREIERAGAHTVLFATWARYPQKPWYSDANAFLISPEAMQDALDSRTKEIAQRVHASVLPVGDRWALVTKRSGTPILYAPDGSHPSVAGTYFTALIFYKFFSGHGLEHMTYVPGGVSEKDAQALMAYEGR
jgi:hypothetical protein